MRKKKPTYEAKLRLRKGDEVVVLSGKDKGKRAKIIQTLPEEGKVIVDGVNIVTKHQKPRSTSSRAMVKQQLGEMQVPLGIPVSKVMLICPKCNKETRPKADNANGEHGRACRKCGQLIGA